MGLKVYGIPGRTQAIVQIPVGKAFLPVEFKRGRQGLGPNDRPALFSTRNVTVQQMIENSPLFGREIKLIRAEASAPVQNPAPSRVRAAKAAPAPAPVEGVEPAPAPESAAPAPNPGEEPAPAAEEHPEVTTKEQAIALLKSKGAKATELTDEKFLKTAAKKNISFPNLQ